MVEINQERAQQLANTQGTEKYDRLLFSVRLSVRYHTRRRLFFETIDQWTNGLSVVFGSATFAAVFSKITTLAMVTGLLTSIFSAISVVMAPGRKARLHHDLT